jgi:polysaccharide deacetylase family protein (PEP-CTERM system associated)
MSKNHCLTIDLEDWYHCYPPRAWSDCTPRIVEPMQWLLDLLDTHSVRATVFVLGYIAERHPEIVERIANGGHEIGTHGYHHRFVHRQTEVEFGRDLARSISAITRIAGTPPCIFRAPSFSVTRQTPWVWKVLLDNGIQRDSSLFAARRRHGGFPGTPRRAFRFQDTGGGWITEYPIGPARIMGLSVPFAGGGYFRACPDFVLKTLTRNHPCPVIFYIHPRDVDRGVPHIREIGPFADLLLHVGLKGARKKMKGLLAATRLTSISDAYDQEEIPTVDLHHR